MLFFNRTANAADIQNPMLDDTLENPAGLSNYIAVFWQVAYVIAGLMVLAYLVYGGISYMSAAGDEEQLENARKTIYNALMGLIIIAASYAIIKILEIILGIDIFNILWPTPL